MSASTGLVNAVPVLWVKTSSRQTAARAKTLGVVAADGLPVVLPADAANPQAGDLVAAPAAEQPGQRYRADQLHRRGDPQDVIATSGHGPRLATSTLITPVREMIDHLPHEFDLRSPVKRRFGASIRNAFAPELETPCAELEQPAPE
ncbi:hypothetical protein [Actinomadura soli]|uniref:hypothetical protein n=1 Tax=Actinomadura soli TaxID=2508997 RepID=UPI00197AA47C|nr:hypothetical protein [Actinomadura soli]